MAHRGNFPFGPVGVPGVFGLRREIDRLFEDAFGGNAQSGTSSGQSRQTFTPAVDAREEEREITLHMDLPGVRPEDVELSVENGLLTVRGQRHQRRKEGQEGRYQFMERSYGSFVRQFHLPQGVDEGQISADFDQGELTIRIPKPQQPQPRRIQVGRSGAGDQQQLSSQGGDAKNGENRGASTPSGGQPSGGQPSGSKSAGGKSPGSKSSSGVSTNAGAASAPGAGGSPAAGAGMDGGSMDTGAAGGALVNSRR